MSETEISLEAAARAAGSFAEPGSIAGLAPYGDGHINASFRLRLRPGAVRAAPVARPSLPGSSGEGPGADLLLQRINERVFRDPEALMGNLLRVTSHLRAKLEAAGLPEVDRRTLTVVPALDGRPLARDAEGGSWRALLFIGGARSAGPARDPGSVRTLGAALGRFQALLADLPPPRLAPTIPRFHDARSRLADFERAADRDLAGRAASVGREIDFFLRRRDGLGLIAEALESGAVRERITHNDAKGDNLLVDEATGEALCLVDLDTVMPGLAHYDFGDMVRTATSPTVEDELDLAKVEMQMPLFEGLARGYLEGAGSFLTSAEKSYLAFAGKLITFTIGIRFLTDFLRGDKYFRVHRPNHNLDRCRTQFKLVQSIHRQEEAMQALVNQI